MSHDLASAETPDSAPATNPPAEGTLHDYVRSLIVTIVLALFGTTFLVQAFKIPSASMSPSLLVGDHLLVNKFIYGASGTGEWYQRLLPYRPIRRGDVIVFKYPYEDHPYYVKRVIGIPGDRIRIVDQHVYLNGSSLKEPYAAHDPSSADPYMFDFPPADPLVISAEITPEWMAALRQDTHGGELFVPPNQYFVMGDNRNDSSDSRYWGFVPRNAVVGRPLFVYWSLVGGRAHGDASSIAQEFANLAKDLLDLPFRTRWGRTFHEVH